MKLKEKLNEFNKEMLFDAYSRIVPDFKEYQKITKEKMKEAIQKEYEDYNHIINICTTKELEYLKMLVENNNKLTYNSKYDWEIKTLNDKLLITWNKDIICITEEIYNQISKSIKEINIKQTQHIDKINELAIGICKVHGIVPIDILTNTVSYLLNIEEKEVLNHIASNRVFNYYIFFDDNPNSIIKSELPNLIYRDYFGFIEEIIKTKYCSSTPSNKLEIKDYTSIFYNDLNLNNEKINKFYRELLKLDNYEFLRDMIIINILLNHNHNDIHELVRTVYSNQIENIDNFIELLDDAIKEMPSASLKGINIDEILLK